MSQITFTDKEARRTIPIDEKYQLTAENANEIKDAVNALYDGDNSSYLSYYLLGANETTDITDNSWIKLTATTTVNLSNNGFAHTSNRVTNSGSETKVCKVEGILSLSSGNNNEIHIAFFKNGVIVPCSEQETFTSSNGKVSCLPFQCLTTLTAGQYVEVWVKNVTAVTDVVTHNLNVIITKYK
jgi:hypothetical protein